MNIKKQSAKQKYSPPRLNKKKRIILLKNHDFPFDIQLLATESAF